MQKVKTGFVIEVRLRGEHIRQVLILGPERIRAGRGRESNRAGTPVEGRRRSR